MLRCEGVRPGAPFARAPALTFTRKPEAGTAEIRFPLLLAQRRLVNGSGVGGATYPHRLQNLFVLRVPAGGLL